MFFNVVFIAEHESKVKIGAQMVIKLSQKLKKRQNLENSNFSQLQLKFYSFPIAQLRLDNLQTYLQLIIGKML